LAETDLLDLAADLGLASSFLAASFLATGFLDADLEAALLAALGYSSETTRVSAIGAFELARVASGRAGTDTGSTTEVTGSMATFANLNTLPIAPLKCERDRYNAYLI